jgi:hypothetical protein
MLPTGNRERNKTETLNKISKIYENKILIRCFDVISDFTLADARGHSRFVMYACMLFNPCSYISPAVSERQRETNDEKIC